MSRKDNVKMVIAAYAGASVLAACSQYSQEISHQKSDLDRQKDLQMQMVDNKTVELKHNVETNKKLALQNINEQKKALSIQEQNLDAEKAKVNASAEYADKNLNDQATACKTTIKSNLNAAKEQVDENARAAKVQ